MKKLISRGAGLNLFRYAAMVLVLLTLGITNAWAGHDQHTATLKAEVGTGSGTVYASTSGSATSGSASASFNCGKSIDGQHTGTLYAYATPASGYTFLGWTTSASSSAGADNSNPKGVAFNVTDGSSTQTLYAHFVEKAKVNITFVAPSNGTYTIKVNGGSAETVSSADVVKSNVTGVTLTATPASGYAFAGWYKLNSAGEFVEDLSIASPYDAAFTKSETIKMGARFVPTTLGKFILKGSSTQYYGLKMATIAAGGSGTIVPVAEETLVDGSDLMPFDNGTYTIKAGATLLVPYSSANEVQTKPKDIAYNSTGWTKALSIYKKLKLGEGVNINVLSGGVICIGGQLVSYNGGNPSAYPIGACGVIDMSSGGHIELNGTLYCWGFIKGQDMDQGNNTTAVGTITANNGAVIWEDFAVGDWRGGTACSTIAGNASSWKFFPFQSYTIQNVEVPTTYKYGSTLSNYTNVYGGGGKNEGTFSLIGNSNTLFLLKNASSFVRKWYDPTTDLVNYELSGTAQLDALNVDAGITTVSSSSYNLPISSNMQIVLTNCNMTISKPMIVQPGAVIEIKNDATLTLASNAYIFDVDNWGKYCNGRYFYSMDILTNHKNRGTGTSKELLDDATLIVDGTLNVTGKLYTTAGGADIMGNGGGSVKFSSLGGSGNIVMCTGVSTNENVAIAQANMHNEDDSYTQAKASTFYNVNSRWFITGKQNINSTTHVYDEFKFISSGAVSGTDGTTTTTPALYGEDKTGLVAGMKWCNVAQDGTCPAIYNATQDLNGTPAANIRYTYQSSDWLQLLKTETEGVYGGSDNNLYAVDGCSVTSLGSVDENCLYTIGGVKKALVDGHFVALEKNTEDEAWHDVANPTNYYISFAGCTWHPATKYAGEEKAYIVEGGDYIWYNNDWLLVEREDPFFFDYNDQNVKRYYEYEDGAWGLAEPRVRVVDAIEPRDFYFINEAFTVANGKKNTTITLLKDIPTITAGLTYSAKNTTCTLDLNGHILPGSISSMLKIDASGSTFTITDNSEDKLGRIQLTVDDNARRYCVNLTSGNLILNAGTISAVNTKAYDKANSITATQSCGLIVKPGMTFTMNGGRIEALAAHNPWGIYVEGSTTSGGTITINGGTVHSETTQISSPYGIYGYGTWNINSGATIEAVAQTTSACALYVEATTSKYFGTLNLKGGTINATSTTNTATGVFVNGVYIMAKTTPNTISSTYRAVANITGGTINAITNGTTTAYGIQSRGTTTIANATVNVTPKTTTGYGLLVQDGTTTINSGTFNVNATTTAKGIYANGAQPDDKTGRPYNPNVIVNGGVFNVTATTSTPSHGIHMDCNIRNITSTASGYYAGVYSSIPTVTVNGGEFYVHSTTKEAWGAYVGRNYRFETGTNTVAEWYRPTLTINDGKFEVTTGSGANAEAIRSYGTTHVNGGDFTATAKTSAAYGFRVMDGIGTTSNNPKFTVKATTTSAFGAVADVSQPADKTGVPCQGDLTIGGGTFDVDAVTSDAYGLYVNASGRVITSTADGYYPGDYSSIGRSTVNSGTFNVTTTTLNAIGAYVKRDVQANRYVSKGELTINDGDFTVATSVQTKGKNCVGIWTYGTTTVNGGTFEVTAANSTTAANGYYAFGVYALDGNTIINNSPAFTVKAYANAYGVYANADQANSTTGLTYNSDVTINGGTYNVSTTGTTGAIGAIVSVPAVRVIASGDYAGDYYSTATMTINDGTFNVEAATTTATGAYAGRNYVSANTMPNTFSKYNYGNLIIHGGTFNVSTNSETGTTTADGVKSHGTTLVDGGTFNVTPKTTTAFGVRVYAGKTTINETAEHSPEFNVTATTTAYGVMAGGGEAPNSSTGLCYDGEVEVNAGTFNVETTSDKPAYGVYVYVETRKITSTSSGYYRGNYAYAGIATINGGEFNVTSKKTEAYGIFVPAGATQSGATAYDPASATPECTVNGGKFWITGTSAIYMTNTKALTDNYKIYGGYYGGALNADYGLSKYAVSPKQVITLNDQNANYPKYTYKVGDGATITWKNGSTTLTSTPNLFELEVTPVYYGTEPTKDADAQYTYTFDGWSTTDGGDKLASLPVVSADATYFAHYSKTERKYTVNVSAGEHGSVSPASVSNIGCETASGDITATPNVGYSFSGWTLPEGVTLAEGYELTSNPIRIHAIAADKTITANFVARTDINYTVKHWQQNIENDEYTEVTADQETKQGTTATPTAAAAKSYTGFTALPITQETIAGDGTTVVSVYYNRNTFAVTWNWNESGTPTTYSDDVKYGAAPVYSYATPTKPSDATYNYTFTGWSDGTNTYAVDAALPAVTAATTYTATFSQTENKYTVAVAAGANGAVSPASVSEIGCETASGDITATPNVGYSFSGWTLPEGVTAADGYTVTSNPIRIHATAAGKTITASFVPRTDINYTVKHWQQNIADDDYTEVTADQETKQGTTATATAATAKSYTGFAAQPISQETIAGDGTTVVSVYYNRNTFAVTWNWNESGTPTTYSEDVKYGAAPVYSYATPTKPSDATYNYTFTGWSDGTNTYAVDAALPAVTTATTYTATFSQTENKYTVAVAAGANGAVSPASVSEIGCETASADITATPDAGYAFNGWTLPDGVTAADGYTVASNPIRIHAIAADKTITANFVARTDINYTVKHWQQNIADDDYTEVTADQETKQGTTATATAATAKSYTGFTAQPISQETIAGDGTTVVNIYYNRKTYTIAWVDGDGNTEETDPKVKYGAMPSYDGATPTKTATDQYTYTFNNTWSPALAYVTGDATYTAQFSSTVNQYTLTVQANDPSMGTVTGGGEYDYNSVHTIKATPKAGCKFVEWNDGNKNASREVTVTADVTYTATFDIDVATYTVKHWQQNITDNNYTEYESETLSGTIGETTNAVAKSYTGFTAQPISQQTIALENTVVNIYYNRATYTISWIVKLSGEIVDSKEETLRYGATPSFGPDPTKEQDDRYEYSFSGWTPTIAEVTANQTYEGTFDATARTYDVTWNNADGTLIEKEENVYTWGAQPSFKGSTPEYSDATGNIYVFRGWKCGRTGVEYAKDATLPVLAGNETYTATYDIQKILDVPAEHTISVNTTVDITTVHVAGKLNVVSGSLTTGDLILEGSESASGEVIGDVTAANAYFDLSHAGGFKAKTWYAVAVPWQVDVKAYAEDNGVYIINGNAEPVRQKMGTSFDLIYYDGECRASDGHSDKCWKFVEDDVAAEHIMKPGRAYMIYLTSDAQTIRFERKAGTALQTPTLAVSTHSGNGKGKDANWNGIANPATYHAYINANADTYHETENAGQIYDAENKRYNVVDLSSQKLVVGQPVFIQAKEDNPSVKAFADAFHAAPRRTKATTTPLTRCEILFAASGTEESDRIIVRADEDKEVNEYTVGQDLVKMGVSNLVPQMWIDRYDAKLCINTLAPVNDAAVYPLGIFAPQTGEYTISINEQVESDFMLYLTIDGRSVWNLTYAPYTATLEQGTTNRYGLKLVRNSNAPAVTTGIQDAQADATAQKIVLDGQVYILRGNNVYSVDGRIVK